MKQMNEPKQLAELRKKKNTSRGHEEERRRMDDGDGDVCFDFFSFFLSFFWLCVCSFFF